MGGVRGIYGHVRKLHLIADRPLEQPDFFVYQLHAPHRSARFKPLKLVLAGLQMLVVGGGEFVINRLDAIGWRQERPARVPSALLEVNQHAALGHRSVGGVETGIGQAEETVIPNRRSARRTAIALRCAVWQTPKHRVMLAVLT